MVAILTAVALPSYRQYVQKSRRADATTKLLTLAQAMERWYSERGTYAGATVGPGVGDHGLVVAVDEHVVDAVGDLAHLVGTHPLGGDRRGADA